MIQKTPPSSGTSGISSENAPDAIDMSNDPQFKKWLLNQTLIYAAKEGNMIEVKAALMRGADIHTDDNSAIIYASGNGHLETVKLLVENGADIHFDNDSPLANSCYYGQLQVTEYLIYEHSCCPKLALRFIYENLQQNEISQQVAIVADRCKQHIRKILLHKRLSQSLNKQDADTENY